jgi:hypothetical protein
VTTPEDGTPEIPPEAILLTRDQACRVLQVSPEVLDEWTHLSGFPVIRRNGGHFVRIHRSELERWTAEFALRGGQSLPSHDLPPEKPRRLRPAR